MALTTEPAIGFYTADSRLLDRIYAVARLNGSPFSPRYATEIGNVYALLHKLVQSKGEQLSGKEGVWRMISQAYVAEQIGSNERTVRRHFKRLEKAGLIKYAKHGFLPRKFIQVPPLEQVYALARSSGRVETATSSHLKDISRTSSGDLGAIWVQSGYQVAESNRTSWPSRSGHHGRVKPDIMAESTIQESIQEVNPSNQVRVPLTSFAGRSASASLDPSNQAKVQEKSEPAEEAPAALDKEEDRVMPWDDIESPLEGLTEASERVEEPSTPDPFVNSFAASPVAPPTEQSHPGVYTDKGRIKEARINDLRAEAKRQAALLDLTGSSNRYGLPA